MTRTRFRPQKRARHSSGRGTHQVVGRRAGRVDVPKLRIVGGRRGYRCRGEIHKADRTKTVVRGGIPFVAEEIRRQRCGLTRRRIRDTRIPPEAQLGIAIGNL